MEYNAKIFDEQRWLIKFFVYHLTYYRELRRTPNLTVDHAYFWKFTVDAHLLQATIYWCMVFGSRKSNPTHWKHLAVSENDAATLHETFRKAVLKRTGFTSLEWDKYWNEMVDFRNKYVVHKDNFQGHVPHFGKALNVAQAYDTWVRKLISPDYNDEPRLRWAVDEAKKSIRPFLKDLAKLKKRKNPPL